MSNNIFLSFNNFCDQQDDSSKGKVSLQSSAPEDFTLLEERLKTFSNFPNNQISKDNLAKAGFIYTGKDDIVICPFCKVEGFCWATGDNPMEDHKLWSPDCSYLKNDVDRVKSIGPQYQDKITYESRLYTFQKWPKAIKQRPADLAEAGFYYTGIDDQTLCFHCGGGLKDWEENDDPWEQHALWFSKCVYLNLKKGPEFVKQMKLDNEPQLSIPDTSGTHTKDESSETLSEKCEKVNIQDTEAADKTLCKICYKNGLGVVFLPCGHIVACADCAAALKNCAVCRKPLGATVRAFLIHDTKAADKTLCKICCKNELGVVFLPCGHILACADCAVALKNCAVCRKPLDITVRAFLS